MDLRIALADLAHRYQLSPQYRLRLQELARLDSEPDNLKPVGLASMAIAGAVLIGLGVIFWIAANWDDIGRFGKFALLQIFVVIMCAGALWRPRARLALSVLAILGIGGLFAYFGQTYQTGADPWQLFALWAALTLPICLSVRNDVTWLPWLLVFGAALSLWVDANVSRTSVMAVDLPIHLMSWSVALLACVAFSPALQKWSGAGQWTMRLATLLATFHVASISLGGMFATSVAPQYWIGLAILAAAAAIFSSRRVFDLASLSAVALALNATLIAGIARALLDGGPVDQVMAFMLVGLIAAIILALTVKIILGRANMRAARGAA